MRSLRIASIILSVASLSAAPAWAQFGLYGAPETLNLPQVQPLSAPYGGSAGPGAYPAPPAARPITTAYTAPGPAFSQPYAQPAAAGSLVPRPRDAMPLEPVESPAAARSPSLTPSMVNQMFDQNFAGNCYESTAAPPACGCNGCGDGCYGGFVERFRQAACGSCGDDGCGCSDCCPWYADVNALVMTRDQANRVWTSYLWNHDAVQIANSNDVSMPWQGGVEVSIGRRFCCDQWSLEATYWTLDAFDGQYEVTGPTGPGVATPLNDLQVTFHGVTSDNWFGLNPDTGTGAEVHRLTRHDEFHNVEVNAIRNRLCGGCNSALNIDCLAGFRFFRFEDDFALASVQGGGSWSDPSTVAYLENRVANNLWGFQMGFNADYCFGRNLRLFATPKFGIYDNHVSHNFNIHLGDGTPGSGDAYGYGDFPVETSGDAVAFLTQIDVGLDWRFAQRWSARVGYRLVAATGIALAENQMPQYLVDIPEITHVKTNGDLILHGAFAGLTYNF
jgi:hypothetical protein